MVQWNATIDGTSVQNIFNIDIDDGSTNKLGQAIIECSNNTANRAFGSGEKVYINKNGQRVFSGFVTGKPSKAGTNSATLNIECKDTRLELKYEQVNRVFYQMDSGNIIKEALGNEVTPESATYVHTGKELTGWSSDAPVFELGDIPSQTLFEAGYDFLFVGWHEGASGSYNVTYTNVPSRAIPGDGQIDRMETRVLVNNRGQQFNMEVNLRDNSGNNYNWPINLSGNDFSLYELNAEEAVPEASIGTPLSTNGALEYRFEIDGQLPESRAVAIDYARTYPFSTSSRSTTLTDTGIETTGNTITRRVDASIFDLIKDLSTEDNFISYATPQDVLHYEPSGQTNAPEITYSNTPVIGADFKRDYENIINKVTVQGAGDIRVTLRDKQSIKFYGVSAREQPIVDKSIQSKKDAVARGRGYLREKAWDDTAFEFEIADESFKSTTIGQDIYINWPPENIQGIYGVSSVSDTREGIVTLGITASDAL